ncbi:MAG: polysaccharide deacetylase family protein, partial [Sulfobacillus thermosulfidooxidans]
VRDIARQGSAVANHGWQHLNLRRVGAAALWQDASKSQDFVRSLGVDPSLFYRPPYGLVSQPMIHLFADHGYTVVLWSIDTRDWARPGVGSIINKVATQVKPGSIILMHDGGGNRSQTATALNAILEQLKQMGYQAVTLPQLIQDQVPHSSPI